MDEVTSEFRLSDEGWAQTNLRVGRAIVVLCAQLSSDPLNGLATAALVLAREESRAEAYWDAVDGSRYWWELTHMDDGMRVEVVKLRAG